MPSPNVGGPLSVVRVLDVRDINIKAEACNLHCGMILFGHDRENAGLPLHGKRIAGEQVKMREFFLTANAKKL